MMGEASRSGRPVSIPDAKIAAIVGLNGGRLATRNLVDFGKGRIDVVYPCDSWPGFVQARRGEDAECAEVPTRTPRIASLPHCGRKNGGVIAIAACHWGDNGGGNANR